MSMSPGAAGAAGESRGARRLGTAGDSESGPQHRNRIYERLFDCGGLGEIARLRFQIFPKFRMADFPEPPKILHQPTPKFFYNTKCQNPVRPQHPVFSKFHLSPVMFFGQTPVLGPTPYAEPSPRLKRYA